MEGGHDRLASPSDVDSHIVLSRELVPAEAPCQADGSFQKSFVLTDSLLDLTPKPLLKTKEDITYFFEICVLTMGGIT